MIFVPYRARPINRTQVVRLLKLLRYFESLRLLVDAAANSVEALPVLFYTLALGSVSAAFVVTPSSLSEADVKVSHRKTLAGSEEDSAG